jgi:hypothetical protein
VPPQIFVNPVLPPMSFDQDPSAVAMNPAMSDPDRTWMRRVIPAAGNPDIVRTIPAVITVDPHESSLRWWRTALHNRSRRPYPDVHLCERGRGEQSESKQSCHCNLFHSRKLLQRLR